MMKRTVLCMIIAIVGDVEGKTERRPICQHHDCCVVFDEGSDMECTEGRELAA